MNRKFTKRPREKIQKIRYNHYLKEFNGYLELADICSNPKLVAMLQEYAEKSAERSAKGDIEDERNDDK